MAFFGLIVVCLFGCIFSYFPFRFGGWESRSDLLQVLVIECLLPSVHSEIVFTVAFNNTQRLPLFSLLSFSVSQASIFQTHIVNLKITVRAHWPNG